MQLYKQVWPVNDDHATVAMVGSCVYVSGSAAMTMELQARWAAAVFSGNCHLPSRDVMRVAAEKSAQIENAIFSKIRGLVCNCITLAIL